MTSGSQLGMWVKHTKHNLKGIFMTMLKIEWEEGVDSLIQGTLLYNIAARFPRISWEKAGTEGGKKRLVMYDGTKESSLK